MYGDRKVRDSWRVQGSWLPEDMGTSVWSQGCLPSPLRQGLAHEQSELRLWCCSASQGTGWDWSSKATLFWSNSLPPLCFCGLGGSWKARELTFNPEWAPCQLNDLSDSVLGSLRFHTGEQTVIGGFY